MTQLEITDIVKQTGDEIEVDSQGRGKGSIRAVARLAGVHHNSIRNSLVCAGDQKPSKLAQMLIKQGYDKSNMAKWCNETTIPEKAILVIIEYYAMYAGRYTQERAKQALMYYRRNKTFNGFQAVITDKKNYIKPEEKVRNQLVEKLKKFLTVRTEVSTLAGRIDILTDIEIIEVKIARDWKCAIGQAIVYGSYYPAHQKRIHLFGEPDAYIRRTIQQHCDQLGINLTWHT